LASDLDNGAGVDFLDPKDLPSEEVGFLMDFGDSWILVSPDGFIGVFVSALPRVLAVSDFSGSELAEDDSRRTASGLDEVDFLAEAADFPASETPSSAGFTTVELVVVSANMFFRPFPFVEVATEAVSTAVTFF